MASIVKKPNGRVEIQFIGPDKKRRTVRLGKIGPTTADEIKGHIENLAECWKYERSPCSQTDRFVSKLLADKSRLWLYDRLAAAGLVVARDIPEEIEAAKLGNFIDAYIESRTDIEQSTVYNLKLVQGRLVEYFGADKPIGDVSLADADAWRLWLQERIGPNTTRRFCGRAKQFFRWAVRKRILTESPFADMKGLNVQANKEREFFIDRAMAQKVLDACPDAEWRLLFALARYGGLRNPSETLLLTWADIDWEHSRITVHSPKTKRYEGKDTRVIPLFPELRPYLEEAFDQAAEGTVYLVTRHRVKGMNLRTQLERIIKRAGLKAWPKLWQNLRASRATELAAEYPAHVAAAWLGHSTLVAQKHYWQVTDSDFAKAVSEPAAKSDVKSDAIKADFIPLATHEAMHETSRKHGETRQKPDKQATRPGLEPGMREPKSLVLPITPPGSELTPLS